MWLEVYVLQIKSVRRPWAAHTNVQKACPDRLYREVARDAALADLRAHGGGLAFGPWLTICVPTVLVRSQLHEPLNPSELVHEPVALLQSVKLPINVAEAGQYGSGLTGFLAVN
jgi:hypothetical protein